MTIASPERRSFHPSSLIRAEPLIRTNIDGQGSPPSESQPGATRGSGGLPRTKSPFTAQLLFPVESLISTITLKSRRSKFSHKSRKNPHLFYLQSLPSLADNFSHIIAIRRSFALAGHATFWIEKAKARFEFTTRSELFHFHLSTKESTI
jgi:hypothetical protein